MNRFLQLHLLTVYPPANLNRDDTGRPKTAVLRRRAAAAHFLAVAQARLAHLRRVRRPALEGHLGKRTQRLRRRDRGAPASSAAWPRPRRSRSPREIAGPVRQDQAREGQNPTYIEQLAFVSPDERAAALALAERAGWRARRWSSKAETVLAPARRRCRHRDVRPHARRRSRLQPRGGSRRWRTRSPRIASSVEDDYYTAVDDLKTAGRGCRRRVRRRGRRSAPASSTSTSASIARCWRATSAATRASPGPASRRWSRPRRRSPRAASRRASPAARAPTIVLAETGDTAPRTLAAAFLKPVTGDDLLRQSIEPWRDARGLRARLRRGRRRAQGHERARRSRHARRCRSPSPRPEPCARLPALHARTRPLAALGEVAVGERRRVPPARPARPCSACSPRRLGIERRDEAAHAALDRRLRRGAAGRGRRRAAPGLPHRPGAAGQEGQALADPAGGACRAPARDYPVAARVSRRRPAHGGGLDARTTPPQPLAALAEALRRPRFTLYLGRKACPLGLPPAPRIVGRRDPRRGLRDASTRDMPAAERALRGSLALLTYVRPRSHADTDARDLARRGSHRAPHRAPARRHRQPPPLAVRAARRAGRAAGPARGRAVMSGYWLTRVRLRRDAAAAALAPVLLPADADARAGAAHRLLWTLFADHPERRRDFLWREDSRGGLARPCLVPRPLRAAASGSARPVRARDPSRSSPLLAPGDRLGFSLRANPVVTRADPRDRPAEAPRRGHGPPARPAQGCPRRCPARGDARRPGVHGWPTRAPATASGCR